MPKAMRSLPFVKYQLKKAVPKPKKVFGRFAYFMVKVGVVQPSDYLYMLLWVEQYRLPFAIGIFIFVQAYTIAYDKVALVSRIFGLILLAVSSRTISFGKLLPSLPYQLTHLPSWVRGSPSYCKVSPFDTTPKLTMAASFPYRT
jgi:hypothetical protein